MVCTCAASSVFAAEVPGYEEQLYQLRRIKGRMIMAATGTLLPSGVWQPLTRRTEEDAAQLLAEPGGWWSSYNDIQAPEISHNGSAWRKAATLARAWAMPQSRYRDSKEVLQAITAGLQHLQQFAYPDSPRPNNWWAWEIGMPMHVLETLLLCGEALDPALRQKQVDTLADVLKVRPDMKLSGPAALPLEDRPGKTDMNALWRARLCLQLAIVTGNPAMAGRWARTTMSEIGLPGKGHLQEDYSYKFHGSVPMWAYGRGFLSEYANLMEATRGTAFGPNADQIERFAHMAMHYANGFLYHGSICPAIIGREITRGDDVCHDGYGPGGLHALAALVRIGHPEATRMAGIIARDRQYFTDARTAERITQLTAGVPRVPPAPPVNDIFAYPDSDFVQVTRPTWAMGIKMHSRRNRGFESINGENLQGWFLSHGSTFHFLSGSEWRGCWPTLDWTRLPGTTACTQIKSANESPFAGMVRSSEERALAAMELSCGEFRARKSWLVDRDAIVCLGSDISGPGRVETTVFNQPVGAGAALVIDGEPAPGEPFEREVRPQWVWLERVGYVFPALQQVHLKREERRSDWSSVRDPRLHGAEEQRATWFLTGFISHDPSTRGYSYIMIPDVPSERMPELARSVVERYRIETAGAHQISVTDADAEAIVFWQPGQAGSVQAERAGLLMRQKDAWHAADPAWSEQPLSIKLGDRTFEPVSRNGRAVRVAENQAATQNDW